jgi:hypothetical protein
MSSTGISCCINSKQNDYSLKIVHKFGQLLINRSQIRAAYNFSRSNRCEVASKHKDVNAMKGYKQFLSEDLFEICQPLPYFCPQQKAYANHPYMRGYIFWHTDLPA